ncbi:MAG: hypothetical protein KJ077_09600 [Anaerolineae bacterium]|nr:hypothetical protein [Anaerolineae bacterium]
MKQRIVLLLSAIALALTISLVLILPLSVRAAGGSITQTSTADFSQSCTVLTNTASAPVLANTHVSDVASGTVTLAATFLDDFNVATLDPRWETGNWSGSSAPLISSSILTVPTGTWVRSTGTYTYGVIEAVAEFGPGMFQHIGFASSEFAADRYFIFSTAGTTDTLFARVNNSVSEQSVNLGPLPTGLHRYTIQWKPLDATTDHISFFLNGTIQAEFDVTNVGATGFHLYLSNNGAADLQVDKAQVEPPYVSSGTYTSCALDADSGNGWQTISWDASLTSSTTLTVEARVSTNGSTWSAWESVANGGPVNSSTLARYAQYRLFLATGDTQLSPEVGSVTLDYNTLPSLSINDVSITEGNTGTVNTVFTVTLAATSTYTTTVNYTTAISTAVAPADYLTAAGLLTFPPDVTSRTITVAVVGDLIDETDEKFLVNLSNPANATIADSQGVGTITDDDPAPTVSINDVAVAEGNSGTVNAAFTVSLSQASGKSITVDYATVNSSATAPGDYLAASGRLTFTPGITTQQITVVINGDSMVEPNETFQVNLTNLVNLNAGGNDTQGIGTITNDDAAGVTIIQSGGNTNVAEGGAADTYQIQLTSQPLATVTISVNPGSQVSVNPVSVVFTTTNWNAAQTITVTAVNDLVAEGAHTGVISHTASSTDSNYNGLAINNVTANITDNDTAGVSVAPTVLAVTEGGITATYAISLTSQPVVTVTVSMTTNGQVSVGPVSLNFNSSNWNISRPVVVTAINDTVSESSPHSGVITHTVTSADSKYHNIATSGVTANITDNDVVDQKVFLPVVIK